MDDPWGSPWAEEVALEQASTSVTAIHSNNLEPSTTREIISLRALDNVKDTVSLSDAESCDAYDGWTSAPTNREHEDSINIRNARTFEEDVGHSIVQSNRVDEHNGISLHNGLSSFTRKSPDPWMHPDPAAQTTIRRSPSVIEASDYDDQATPLSSRTSIEQEPNAESEGTKPSVTLALQDSSLFAGQIDAEHTKADNDFGDYGDFEDGTCDQSVMTEKGDTPLRSGIPTINERLIDEVFAGVSDEVVTPVLDKDLYIESVTSLDGFDSLEQRRTWYRISRYGTKRKFDLGDDDDYVRITWAKSQVRHDTLAVVASWVLEDRGGRKFDSRKMFSWREPQTSEPKVGMTENIESKTVASNRADTTCGLSAIQSRGPSTSRREELLPSNTPNSSSTINVVAQKLSSPASVQFSWSSNNSSIQPLKSQSVRETTDSHKDTSGENRAEGDTSTRKQSDVHDSIGIRSKLAKVIDPLSKTISSEPRSGYPGSFEQNSLAQDMTKTVFDKIDLSWPGGSGSNSALPQFLEYDQNEVPQNLDTLRSHSDFLGSFMEPQTAEEPGLKTHDQNHDSMSISRRSPPKAEPVLVFEADNEALKPRDQSVESSVFVMPPIAKSNITSSGLPLLRTNTSIANVTLDEDDDDWGEMVSLPVPKPTTPSSTKQRPQSMFDAITSSQLDEFFGASRGHKPKLSLSDEIATTNKVQSILGTPALHSPRMSPARKPHRTSVSSIQSIGSAGGDLLSLPPPDVLDNSMSSPSMRITSGNKPRRPSRLSIGASSTPPIGRQSASLPAVPGTPVVAWTIGTQSNHNSMLESSCASGLNTEHDSIVNGIIGGLPNLSYMLKR